ncbi:class I SAM-dependent methyltransferase [Agrobacterium tumefaciens]|uniref:class I SAM-dependent methyltransferase n=1 Tax=Agrobacterium tumefaciens TaxID=358 RepID=UPI0022445A12|nr:class I SAM-dependent methyltransferase [Agrobacterium tumefaciens]MCW8060194.1 methyltransferase domain-containing protein [Agrobacterium tumefaciens]
MKILFDNSVFMDSSNVAVSTNRLNWRAEVLITRNKEAFVGKRVLDLASHDGRFSHAALMCGARHVTGVEARQEHVENARKNFAELGHSEHSYTFIRGDLVAFLRELEPGQFDTILLFGVLAHLIETVEVFREIKRVAPTYFILDGWQAREKLNLVERIRNHKVTEYVKATQQGGPPVRNSLTHKLTRYWDVLRNPAYKTGSLIFLYEDADAAGATIRKSGLMAWPSGSLIEMLFEHFGFVVHQVDWHAQGVGNWTDIGDYRSGDRASWVAQLNQNAFQDHEFSSAT